MFKIHYIAVYFIKITKNLKFKLNLFYWVLFTVQYPLPPCCNEGLKTTPKILFISDPS